MIEFNPSISWQDFGELIYVVHEKTKKEFIFRNSSRIIWLKINNKKTIAEMEEELIQLYMVEQAVIQRDVKAFIESLETEGLIGNEVAYE